MITLAILLRSQNHFLLAVFHNFNLCQFNAVSFIALPRNSFHQKAATHISVAEWLLGRATIKKSAKVAELADAPDLGSGGATRGGSSPPFRTNW